MSDVIRNVPLPLNLDIVKPLADIRRLADFEVSAGLTLGWYVDESSKEDSAS